MAPTPTHPLDAAIALSPEPGSCDTIAPGRPRRWTGHTSAAYANMVGPFGGITAAQALQAVMLHPDRLGEPVSFTGNFAAALADGPFVAEATPARTNRSTQHWIVTLSQTDGEGQSQVVFTATVVTAQRRNTWGTTDARMPEAPPLDSVPAIPRPSRRPPWLDRYDMRWYQGAMPHPFDDSEHPDSITRMWVRDEPPRSLDFPSLVSLCDVFYPRIWLRRAKLVPIGTVSFTVYFHASSDTLLACGTQHLIAEARGQRFFDGYFDQTGALWHPDGLLLATTHQVVYYRE